MSRPPIKLVREIFGDENKEAAQEFLRFFDEAAAKHHPGGSVEDDDDYPNEEGEE